MFPLFEPEKLFPLFRLCLIPKGTRFCAAVEGMMASIFISYSNRDERAALGLQTWLREHSHDVALHPHTKKHEQGAFEDLKTQFQSDIDQADSVILLVTPFWQAAKLCQWELMTAKAGQKSVIAILEAPSTVEFSDDVFVVDMTKNREAGLARLADQLKISGSDRGDSGVVTGQAGADNVVLQGPKFANHDGAASGSDGLRQRLIRPALRRQAGVNRTLKILRRGIRWSALPSWLTNALKLPVAGTRIKARKSFASLYQKYAFKIPSFKSLFQRGKNWLVADKTRVVGASIGAFIVATAAISFVSDLAIGGKESVREELADVKKRQSLLLSRVSNHLRQTGEEETALLLALEAMNEAQEGEDRQKARDSLYTAWIKMRKDLVFRGHDNHVSGAMFSPDGKYILSSSWDKTARVWKVSSKKQVLLLDQHDGFVNGAVYSPDQSLILTAALDNKARLYNARTGKLIRTLSGHSHDLTSAVFSRDGQRIVTASGDQTARVWEVAGGKTLKTFLGHKAGLEFADFSPDGKRIVTASGDKMARILDVASGNRLALLEGHKDVVRSARFDPAGTLIATASEDKTVRLWGARNGVMQRVLKGHKWAVLTAVFSPDGQRLVTASKDNTARIWDVKTGGLILILRGHKGIVSQASFSRNGRKIVTASGDGTIRLWPLVQSDNELVKKARKAATRCLTLEERKKYFLSDTPPDWCVRMKKRPFHK